MKIWKRLPDVGDRHFLEALKNPLTQAELNEVIEEAVGVEASSCPFCGGPAVLRLGGNTYGFAGFIIECDDCHNRTQNILKAPTWNGKAFVTPTLHDCFENALKCWNARP